MGSGAGMFPLYAESMSTDAIPDPRIAEAGMLSERVPTTLMPVVFMALCRGAPAIPDAGGVPSMALHFVLQQWHRGHQWASRGDPAFSHVCTWEANGHLCPVRYPEWRARPHAHCDVLAVSDSIWLWTPHRPWHSSTSTDGRLADVMTDA